MKKSTKAVVVGGASFFGSILMSSSLRSLIKPSRDSTANLAIELSPLLATVLLHYMKSEDIKDAKTVRNAAGAGFALYLLGDYIESKTRFEKSVFAKALQLPYSGIATLVGDQSRAASAMFPAEVRGSDKLKSQVIPYLRDLLTQNSVADFEYIIRDLIDCGMTVFVKDDDGELDIRIDKQFIPYNKAVEVKNAVLPNGSTTEFVTKKDYESRILATNQASVFKDLNADERVILVEDSISALLTFANLVTIWILLNRNGKTLSDDGKVGLLENTTFSQYRNSIHIEAFKLSAFLAEPHFKGQFYSGEDGASYSIPAPSASSAPGYAQLEQAIMLSPEQKRFEGLSDFLADPVVVAPPDVARKLENSNRAQSVGRSRANPELELLVLAVEGDTGRMSTPFEREVSVPQGSLVSPPIRQASNVDVRTGGLFTRGLFTPNYEYRKGQA